MNKIQRSFRLARLQFLYSISSPRYIITFLFQIVYGLYYVSKYSQFATKIGQPVNVMEGYMCLVSSEFTITVLFLAFIIAVSDAPFTGNNYCMEAMRAGKREWITGKIIFIFITSILMQGILLLISVVLLCGNAFSNNAWSYTFVTLVKYGSNMETGILEYNGIEVLKNMTPFGAALAQAGFISLYTFFAGLVLFVISSVAKKTVGFVVLMGIHICGYAVCLSYQKLMVFPFPNAFLPVVFSIKNRNVANSVVYFLTLIVVVLVIFYIVADKKEVRQE